jgi:hypothetical protein
MEEITRPPQKQTQLTNIVLRGPLRSTHFPKTAADIPSMKSEIE